MSDDSPRLIELARSISDGVPVDWERAKREAANVEETERVRALMRLERVVAAHRARHGSPPETPSRRWGPLDVLETIGRGAFGEVYLARDPRLDRQVALKLLRADPPGGASIADAVIEEGRLMARVRHPNVITVYGAERHDGQVGMWMELIQGEPLSEILRDRGVLGAREAGLVGLDLCRALAAVHQAGLAHRDVKAQNVMRENGGRIVLMDFSAGHDLQGSEASDRAISGTPLYMPPETLAGERPDARGDIYSLGVLLFHLVTASFPIVADTLDDLRTAHREGAAQPLAGLRPDLPPAFVRVVEKALSPEPDDRFQSAAAMEQALAAALGVEGVEAPPSVNAMPRSYALQTAVLTGATLLALALTAYVALRRAPAPAAQLRQTAAQADAAPASQPTPVAPAAASEPALAPAAVPAGAYTVEAALLRGTVGAVPLDEGDRVRVGDALSIRLKSSRPLWVYVVNEDDAGVAALLFPLSGSDLSNPLPAGEALLPGSIGGESKYWKVTSAGGREHFLLIASPKQLVDFEREAAGLVRPTETGAVVSAVLSEPAKEQLRGITGLATGPAPGPSGSGRRLFEMAKALEARSEVVQGAWVRRIDLENPER